MSSNTLTPKQKQYLEAIKQDPSKALTLDNPLELVQYKDRYVYRFLAKEENPSVGLIARKPMRNMEIVGHVIKGLRHNGSQFISTSKSKHYCMTLAALCGGGSIVKIDLSLCRGKVWDLSTVGLATQIAKEDARAHGKVRPNGPGFSFLNNCVPAKEVLLEGIAPPEALTICEVPEEMAVVASKGKQFLVAELEGRLNLDNKYIKTFCNENNFCDSTYYRWCKGSSSVIVPAAIIKYILSKPSVQAVKQEGKPQPPPTDYESRRVLRETLKRELTKCNSNF